MEKPREKSFLEPGSTYKELRPPNIYDVAANEAWLEDMSRQGYHLTEFKGSNGVFTVGEPLRCRYRMQLLAKKEAEPVPERIAEYERR